VWKKTEAPDPRPTQPAPPAASRSEPAPRGATIGQSISIRGDVTGDEDLVILGRLEGQVTLPKNSVTIGKSGRLKADVRGRSIHVEGEVRGNLYGEQGVVIRASGRVQGNIVAPRVTLENGSNFKGAIDMEPAVEKAPAAKPGAAAPAATGKPATEGGGEKGKPQLDLKSTAAGG